MGLNNIKKILKPLIGQVQDVEDMFQPFFERLNIATATGEQLDKIGEIVGQPRELYDDDVYRQLIFLRIVRNMSEGTPEELIQIFGTMTGAEIVQYVEQYPAAFTLTAINPDYLFDYPYIWEAIQKAKPAAVGINALIEASEPVFAFLDDTVGVTSGFADVVPPSTPTTGGIFASLMPTTLVRAKNPFDLSPTAIYSTRRIDGCLSSHIMRVHRVTAADDVDIYDVQRDTSNYKLTELGSWIDGSSETFEVISIYDQTGNGRTITAPAAINRGALIFNQHNGWPVVRGDGSNDYYTSTATGDAFIDTTKGTIFAAIKPDDSFASDNAAWKLNNIIQDGGGYYGLSVGTLTTIAETKMFAYNEEETPTQEKYVGADFVDAEFSALAWRYESTTLALFKGAQGSHEMTLIGDETTEDILYLSTYTLGVFGHNVGGSSLFKGDISDVVTFDEVIAQDDLSKMNKYLLEN